MSTTMRAKLQVRNVENFGTSERLSFGAVYRAGGYPADGSDEDNTFAMWTPQADMTMTINNPALIGKFAIGDKFYVDFSPAE